MKIITFLIILLTINVTFAQQTMPVDYTITDTQKRTLTGTILAKTDTHITFQRQQDKKKFKIEINTLSEKDKAFIATIVVKKPTVLFLTTISYRKEKEKIDWLVSEGFDVTIGLQFISRFEDKRPLGKYSSELDRRRNYNFIPEEMKAIFVYADTNISKYEVLWVSDPTPITEVEDNYTHTRFPQYPIIQNAEKHNLAIVINSRNKENAEKVFYNNPYSPKKNTYTGAKGERNYVQTNGRYVFYSDSNKLEEEKETKERLIKTIKLKL